MAYAAASDIESRVGKTFSVAQDTRCGTVLTQMSNYVDGELGSLWEVPFDSPYPNLIVEATILLASGWFVLGEMVDQPQEEAVERRATDRVDRGEKLLERILNKPSLLSGTTAVLRADSETAIGPQMRVSTSPPSITFQDSSTWRKPLPSAAFMARQSPKEYA